MSESSVLWKRFSIHSFFIEPTPVNTDSFSKKNLAIKADGVYSDPIRNEKKFDMTPYSTKKSVQVVSEQPTQYT